MTDAKYPPLPNDVDAAVTVVQAHIDRYHAGLAPDGAAALLTSMVERVTVRASDEYVAQRAKLTELGLDPDVLAPLPVDRKPVADVAAILRFPEQNAHDWLTAAGFTAEQVVEAIARLRFDPDGLDEALEAIEDRTEVADGRVLDVVVERGRSRAAHPLLVDQANSGDIDVPKPKRERPTGERPKRQRG